MDQMIAEPTVRRRKPSTARPVDKPKKTKVGLVISEEAARRLGLFAVMDGRDRSEIVEQLITDHLKGWVVSWRGDRPSPQDVSVPADPAV